MKWLAQVDSNHRPRAYQARALTTWAMSQYIAFGSDICSAGEITSWWNPYGWNPHFVRVSVFLRPLARAVVEMMGFEPMTPCLQGRCSPSWATPPYFYGTCFFLLKDPSKLNNDLSKYSTFYELRLFVAYILVIYGRFSIERRWSSRTFRYGYLVTT